MGPLYYEDWHTRRSPMEWTWDMSVSQMFYWLYDYSLHFLNYLLMSLGDRILAITGGELMVLILVPFLIFTALSYWGLQRSHGRRKTL